MVEPRRFPRGRERATIDATSLETELRAFVSRSARGKGEHTEPKTDEANGSAVGGIDAAIDAAIDADQKLVTGGLT